VALSAANRLSPLDDSHSTHYDGHEPIDISDNESGGDEAYTEPSNTSSTPLTAPSTRSRKFPSDLKTIRCNFPGCEKAFNRPARLTAHMRSHTGDRQFKCEYPGCDKTYLESKHLRQHVKGSHTQERPYKCHECDKSFLTQTRLTRHAAVHTGAERFRCKGYEGCDQAFRKHATLSRHIRTEHMGLKPYACDHDGCGIGFDTAGALKRHVDRQHGELKFWCEECGNEEDDDDNDGDVEMDRGDRAPPQRAGFTTLALLQEHIRKEHVTCMFCDAKCRSRAELERHVESRHSEMPSDEPKAPVACAWEGCSKTFSRPSNLNVHIRTAHEGLRFVCGQLDVSSIGDVAGWDGSDACGNGFISKMKLEEHIRFVHLKMERPKASKSTKLEAPTDLVAVLSGAADQAKRTVACSFPTCDATFIRHHEMNIHLQVHYTVAVEATGPDMDFANVFDMSPGQLEMFDGPPALEPELDQFWIGGGDYLDPLLPGYTPHDEWHMDEAAMRPLIGDEDEAQLADFLDPSLVDI